MPGTVTTLDATLSRSRRRPESLVRLKQASRKLFVERGYDATRPQDIAREAGLGHGTFYLHYADKRACFLAFVDEVRRELDGEVRARCGDCRDLEGRIAATLAAICDFADANPGVLRLALADETMIDAEDDEGLSDQWGAQWAALLREEGAAGLEAEIAGQAIAGALQQAARESLRNKRDRTALVATLTRFVSRALRPAG